MTKQERYRARKVAKGLCRNCTAERGPQGTPTLCRPCADVVAARSDQWYWSLDWKGYAEVRMRNRRKEALRRMAARNASR